MWGTESFCACQDSNPTRSSTSHHFYMQSTSLNPMFLSHRHCLSISICLFRLSSVSGVKPTAVKNRYWRDSVGEATCYRLPLYVLWFSRLNISWYGCFFCVRELCDESPSQKLWGRNSRFDKRQEEHYGRFLSLWHGCLLRSVFWVAGAFALRKRAPRNHI